MNESRATGLPLFMQLLHAAHTVEERLETALAEHHLSLAKFGVLSVLIRNGESMPLSDLARELSCVESNVTQLVDRLETDGLVQREDHPVDRRSIRAAITDSGRQAWQEGERALSAVEKTLFKAFSNEDRARLSEALARFE